MAKTTKKKTTVLTIQPNFEIPPAPKSEMTLVHTPETMLAVAVDKGRSLEEITKLMELYEHWLDRKAKSAFMQAKSNFQFEVQEIRKNIAVSYALKDNKGTVSYDYADLGEIGKAIKPACKNNGLTYDWEIDNSGPRIKVTCVLSHVDGYEKRVTMEGPADTSGGKNIIQGDQSTVTYLERNTLKAALGLTTTDSDTDGRGSKEVPAETVYDDSKHKKSVTPEAYKAYVTAITAGKTTLEEIRANCWLTPDQDEALQAVQRIRDEKMAKG